MPIANSQRLFAVKNLYEMLAKNLSGIQKTFKRLWKDYILYYIEPILPLGEDYRVLHP